MSDSVTLPARRRGSSWQLLPTPGNSWSSPSHLTRSTYRGRLALLTLTLLLVSSSLLYSSTHNNPLRVSSKLTAGGNSPENTSEAGRNTPEDEVVVERELGERVSLLESSCLEWEARLGHPPPLAPGYETRLRHMPDMGIIYCENFKVGSSTWAVHLLTLAHIPFSKRDPVHSLARFQFPPPSPEDRVGMDHQKTPTARFLVVRHPFERLLSAFKDKLDVEPLREVEELSFGIVQDRIVEAYREQGREGRKPTFPEFLRFLVGELSPDPRLMANMTKDINNHWKPIYLNCGLCHERYDLIMKMETFSRDCEYIKTKLSLNIKVGFTRKVGHDGATSENLTLEAFRQISSELKRAVYKIYEPDFVLFGYSAEKYFELDSNND